MYYSIRNKNLQKKNNKMILMYTFFTILVIIIFSFLGIKLLVKVITFITDIKKSNISQNEADTIPPKIPYVYPFSEYTTNESIEIKGEAEISSSLILYLNDHRYDTVVGNTGKFLYKLILNDGVNEFYLYSEDSSGNKSSNTKIYKVTLDRTPPLLEITNPQDKSIISGSKNKIVEIKGKSEKDATVTVNDRFVNTSDDGSFIYKYDLNNGENKLTIKAKDMAGNEETNDLTIYYQE